MLISPSPLSLSRAAGPALPGADLILFPADGQCRGRSCALGGTVSAQNTVELHTHAWGLPRLAPLLPHTARSCLAPTGVHCPRTRGPQLKGSGSSCCER